VIAYYEGINSFIHSFLAVTQDNNNNTKDMSSTGTHTTIIYARVKPNRTIGLSDMNKFTEIIGTEYSPKRLNSLNDLML